LRILEKTRSTAIADDSRKSRVVSVCEQLRFRV